MARLQQAVVGCLVYLLRVGIQFIRNPSGGTTNGSAQQFITRHEAGLLDWVSVRNLSILAHGYEPVSKENWQKVHAWMQTSFLPMLRELAKEAGLKREPEQLPTETPDSIRCKVATDDNAGNTG